MEKGIVKDKLKVFVPARLLSEEETNALPPEKRQAASGKPGLWLEVDCPEGSCSEGKGRITLPAAIADSEKDKGIWLSLFCPEDQCLIEQSTDLP